MKIIGISPLDKDSTVCLVEDGKVLAAVGEERLSRVKMHSGFPYLAMRQIFDQFNLKSEDIDTVVYAFHDWEKETQLMQDAVNWYQQKSQQFPPDKLLNKLKNLPDQPVKKYKIPGVNEEELYMKKGFLHETAYKLLSTVPFLSKWFNDSQQKKWLETASGDHKKWSAELQKGLSEFGLQDKLKRVDHHLTHAANAYFTSGFDEALIVTLDGYGSGLAGSVSVGKEGKIKRLHSQSYPVSLGEFYERVTSSLGFRPGRHEGKIVGLAAYESPDILFDTVRSFFEVQDGEVFYHLPHNIAFSRYLASKFSKPAVAAAWQKVLEVVACEYVEYYVKQTGIKNVVLSGGVIANVKANQRIFEIDGVEGIFVHPNMGDGGCGVGAALAIASGKDKIQPYKINDVYWGNAYSDDEIKEALDKAGLQASKEDYIEGKVAQLLADGNIVARFNGGMEYGPRSLGNRSILYHAKDPSVNLWLNQQLQRTEFMPFAPATLFEERDKCYINMDGAEYTSRFMTITFDCTEFMVSNSPAAVHVDDTARPQLVSEDSNESFYKIIKEFHAITGVPSVINTSFNMHEEPIVCTPADAIRAFQLGNLPYLAIGSYLVKQQ